MENNLNLTPEMLEQAKSAPSADALLTLGQENDITLTTEEAVTYFAQLHPETGALSDEELDNVSGGRCVGPPPICPRCSSPDTRRRGFKGAIGICLTCDHTFSYSY